eukprot:354733-Chlamydomonas_euryale.AAC.5
MRASGLALLTRDTSAEAEAPRVRGVAVLRRRRPLRRTCCNPAEARMPVCAPPPPFVCSLPSLPTRSQQHPPVAPPRLRDATANSALVSAAVRARSRRTDAASARCSMQVTQEVVVGTAVRGARALAGR